MSSNVCLLFFNVLCLTAINGASIDPDFEANKRLCQGAPFKLYDEMKCTAVYNTTSGSFCPASYNCAFNTPKTEVGCAMDSFFDDVMQKKCAPIYEIERPPQYHCPAAFRCHNSDDKVVIPQHPSSYSITTEKCIFGDLKLQIRERLDRLAYHKLTQDCLDCLCQVPPFLTCDRLPSHFCKDNAEISRID